MEIWVSLTLVVTCGLTYYRNRKSCKSLSYYYQNNIIVGTPCDEEVTVPPFTTLERHDGGEGNSQRYHTGVMTHQQSYSQPRTGDS